MHQLLRRYAGYVSSGEIKEFNKLPMMFTFDELQYLYNNGYIYSDGKDFIAAITDVAMD